MSTYSTCRSGFVLGVALLAAAGSSIAACPPAGHDRDALAALKARQFVLTDDAARNALALALLDCLADPDPALRDGVAFEAYATWLRAAQLDGATRAALRDTLLAALAAAADDAAGFRKPFSALVLAEVARTDRIDAWLTPEQRSALVEAAARYVESVRDYRGYDEREGWRHGVAHGADLLLQLALNPALDKSQLDRILVAVASQVAASAAHAYVDGESERLARPVLYVAARAQHTPAEWTAWFEQVAAPTPPATWDDAFRTRTGLARRHNVLAFLRATYVGAREGEDARLAALLPGLRAGLQAMP